MSSLIEKAQERLAQLRRAGVDFPESAAKAPPATVETRPEPTRVVDKPAEVAVPKVRVATSRRVELDMDALAAAGIVTPHAPRSQIADQYRVIKRPLIGNAMGKGASPVENGNLIMVTSSVPGEGKSFTAINLAISIAAELDNTVMLVDADVARPSILRMLGLPPSLGLLDLLRDETADLSTMLLKTNIDALSILPSGTPHERATEMLASDAMTSLIADMGKRYPDRIIVFDSPPLLLTTEARVPYGADHHGDQCRENPAIRRGGRAGDD